MFLLQIGRAILGEFLTGSSVPTFLSLGENTGGLRLIGIHEARCDAYDDSICCYVQGFLHTRPSS